MRMNNLTLLAASLGMAWATATAGAQTIPPERIVPLNSGYPAGQVVYGHAGGMYTTSYMGRYTPPARFPVERIPVQYLRYYPARWYGLPGSTLPAIAPQVHMPTDTTQLGFYSQRVPTWMPVPGMIPPPPNPAAYKAYRPIGYQTSAYGAASGGRIVSSRPVTTTGGGTVSGRTQVTPVPEGTELPLKPPPAPAAD